MSYRPRIFVLVLALATVLAVEAAPAAEETANVMARLPPKLQKLLTEEMIAINAASQKIVASLVSGDSAAVAEQAQGIHDSFILEKKLSTEDREALEQALPPGFLALDEALHGRAQRLAIEAKRGDLELENFFFDRMIETCQACHSRFATGKFPGYASQAPGGKK